MSDEIDFVLPWVDGNDLAWQEEKNRYLKDDRNEEGKSDARFRNWDNLQYWFRSVERYAPWVRKIHFITWGHIPSWLNTDHPKLNIVNHKDYIPEKYLPTFSSHTIEHNLHHIPDLSEQFVYFNDDFFICKPTHETSFFKDGLPLDIAALNVHCYSLSRPIQIIAIRDAGVINEHFNIRSSLKRDLLKWFRLEYGSVLLRTIALLGSPRFPGFYISHTPQPFLKSIFSEVWSAEPEILDETCMHKFREMTDVNQWLMKEWQLASGKFVPRKKSFSRVFFLGSPNRRQLIDDAVKVILNETIPTICINDSNMPLEDFEYCKATVNAAFQKKFPEKCSFER